MSDFYRDQNNQDIQNDQNNRNTLNIQDTQTTQEIHQQANTEYSYSNSSEIRQDGSIRYSAPSNEPHYTAPVSPAPKKEKKQMNSGTKWALRIIGTVLVAVIAFVSGYAGANMANNDLERVVIQRVEMAEASNQPVPSQSEGEYLSSVEIAQKVTPSVVAITTEQMTTNNFWFGSYVTSGAGSGVIISEDGYIITNSHVVSGADTISVELESGDTYPATLIGRYPQGDIAVIKIEAVDLPAASFANSDELLQGEVVYAVGNPEGRFSGSISSGIISALDRQIQVSIEEEIPQDQSGYPFYGFGGFGFGYGYSTPSTVSGVAYLDVIQFDAAVSPGNSGGGLFNAKGELIGIVCAKSADADAEGLGFAISGNKALEIATALMNDGEYIPDPADTENENASPNKAVLGITAAYLDEASAMQYGYKNAGVYVITVTEKSTVDAGLASGDRILGIDSNTVNEVNDVTDYLKDKEPGDDVTLTVERDGKIHSITITLVENESYREG